MRSLLLLFVCFGAVSCTTTTLSLDSNKDIRDLISKNQQLFFEYPASANLKTTKYPGSTSNSITVVGTSKAVMYFYDGKVEIAVNLVSSAAPSEWCSPLALWTSAASVTSVLAGNRNINRALLGTTAIMAASSLMNVALAAESDSAIDIYFNLPGYIQYSSPSDSNGKKSVSFMYVEKRVSTKPFKVPGGTCALGQCGGPSSAGPTGCQCDAKCTDLGDCCDDFTAKCETVTNIEGTTTVVNRQGSVSVFAVGGSTCENRCGGPSADGSCLCDDSCHQTLDCCADKDSKCPASDSKAIVCTCSGKVHPTLGAGQNGGPDCTSPNANPQGFWCYVNKGTCSDGVASGVLLDQDWSLLACSKPVPPAPGTTACKCTPGLVNVNGAGSSDCTSKDTLGPAPGDVLEGWCYTEQGVCTDGIGSGALPGKQYSYLACKGVTPPNAPAPPSTAPIGWTCAAAVYNARDSCDCNCGVRDPDCDIPGLKVSNCLGGQVCNTQGQCQTVAPPGTGGGNTAVRGASLGCTGPAGPGAPGGTRRQLEFLPRIVGGAEVNPKYKQLHLVSLQTGNGFHFCGGSLIYDGTWVLSAAHCLQGGQNRPGGVPQNLGQIVMHRHDLRVPLAQDGATSFKALRVINHPSYNPQTQSNDIALIQLASPNNAGQAMTRAEVPPNMRKNIIKMDDGSFSQENQLVTVAGWGALSSNGPSPRSAQQVTVEYITNQKCQLNGGRAGQPNQYNGRITADMLCAGQKNGAPGKDSCQGDSGGPLTTSCMINGQPRAILVGVVSWGFGCALANLPGVYARVGLFKNWMTGVIGKDPNLIDFTL